MKKSTKNKVPVSERALLARINRQLSGEGTVLKKCRADAQSYSELGDYYQIDLSGNFIVSRNVDLVETGKKLGVLKEWERLL